jgi:hypothetical protein
VNGLDELNGEAPVETALGANGLLVVIVFGVDWLNRLLVGAKAFGCVFNDGKIGDAAGVPEGFGPPASPNIKNVTRILREEVVESWTKQI